jgi:chemotaxis protein MotD
MDYLAIGRLNNMAVCARILLQGLDRGGEMFIVIPHSALKPAPKVETRRAETDVTQSLEVPDQIAEIIEEVTTRPRERVNPQTEMPLPQAAAEPTPMPPEWRAPEAALSAVISRLDQAQPSSVREDAPMPRIARAESHPERPAMPLSDDRALSTGDAMEVAKADEPHGQRFAVSVNAAETRTLPPVKVVVREQETHFEPVQQVTLLQKIVDRMATDLPAAAPQAAPSSSEAALPMPRLADKPDRSRRRDREDAADWRCRRSASYGGSI